MEWIAAHVTDIASVACAGLGAFGGLWAAFRRLRLLLRTEIADYAASKEDVARVEGKVDLVISALLARSVNTKR